MRTPPQVRFWRTPLDAETIPRIRGTVRVLEERCKGCLYCVEFCPRDVFVRSPRYNLKGYHPPDVSHPEQCTACHLCEILCPEFAVAVTESTSAETSHAR